MSAALEIQGLVKRYDTEAGAVEVLRGIDLELAAGERVAVTGPSGCGKSTLLHVVGGLDAPTEGRVRLGGVDPYALSEPELARFRNRSIGFVFQDSHLLPQYDVVENVLLPTLAFGDAPADADGRARALLERVGLGHRLTHRPSQLSGGERQRVAVARAMISDPELLLCDEPTGSLDPASAGSVADLLFELQAERGNLLVVVTHSEDLAGRFERRVDLREGRC